MRERKLLLIWNEEDGGDDDDSGNKDEGCNIPDFVAFVTPHYK